MKQLPPFLLILFLVFSSTNLFSQTINYTYDNAGNRTDRDTIQIGGRESLKSATIKKVIKDDTFGKQNIKIYPNPTRGILEIEIPEDPENSDRIQLCKLMVFFKTTVMMGSAGLCGLRTPYLLNLYAW